MKAFVVSVFVVLFATVSLRAQKSPVFVKDHAAIGGYDPVAFFTESRPVKGNASFSVQYNSAAWYFVNSRNLEAFKKEPAKYAPQYGGYCAYGMAGGHKAPTEPDTWTILNGKLYFNYNTDVKKQWVKKQAAYIITADLNWPKLKDRK